ncbi:glucose-6-phosphate isomerase, partial [Pseudonocardia yunnanensis]
MTARLVSSVPPQADVVERLVDDSVASRIARCDASLWPRAARPGWVTAARASRPLVGEIEALREQLRVAGQVRVVLAAAGGVGVAAEVLAEDDPRLVVLDTTDPAQVADALAGDLAATVLVVSAPPGEDTTAVELVRDTVHRAFRAEGLDPAAQTVVVTAPGGP